MTFVMYVVDAISHLMDVIPFITQIIALVSMFYGNFQVRSKCRYKLQYSITFIWANMSTL